MSDYKADWKQEFWRPIIFFDNKAMQINHVLPDEFIKCLNDIDCVPIIKVSWDSDWYSDPEDNKNACRLIIFAPSSITYRSADWFGLCRYEPAGYSSYTYEPIDDVEIMFTNNLQHFMNLRLSQDERLRINEVLKPFEVLGIDATEGWKYGKD